MNGTLRILVPLDGSVRSEAVLSYLPMLTAGGDLQVTLFSAVDERPIASSVVPGASRSDQAEATLASMTEYLTAVERRLQHAGLTASTVVLSGPPIQRAVEAAKRGQYHLIALAGRAHDDSEDWGRRSVSEAIIRGAEIPVLVTRPNAPPPEATLQHVIVPLDGSRAAEAALSVASALARRCDATLHLLQAIPTPDQAITRLETDPRSDTWDPAVSQAAVEEATRYLRQVADAVGAATEVRAAVAYAGAVEAIMAYAELQPNAMIVMCTIGARGPGATWRMGRVAERVVESCPIPVLVVPPEV